MNLNCFSLRLARIGAWMGIGALCCAPVEGSAQVDAEEGAASVIEATPPSTLRVSLAEAVEIAIARNFALNRSRLDVRTADQQVREAWSEIYPRIDGSASYTRQLEQLNPFAGSAAGDLFGGGFGDAGAYLTENERRVAAGQPELGFQEFVEQRATNQAVAFTDAGGEVNPSDNPFLIDNSFRFDLTATQLIYDHRAFVSLGGAKKLREQQRAAFRDSARNTVRSVVEAYYRVILTRDQVDIFRRSETRARNEVEETQARVQQGTRPQIQLLSTQVRLANAEAVRIRAENDARDALDLLKLELGLSYEDDIVPSDPLIRPKAGELPVITMDEALGIAADSRPDFRAAQLQVDLREVDEGVTYAEFLPVIDAFFTLALVGQVPSNRTVVVAEEDPRAGAGEVSNDPLNFQGETLDFFDSSYWGPDIRAGVRLNWKLFNGFGTMSQLEQKKAATRQARSQLLELTQRIKTEVSRSLRTLRSNLEQLESQDQNVQNAELNYEHARIRVEQGAGDQVLLRDANEQLDNSRLNYLQSVYDYRLAEVQYMVAVGQPPLVDLDALDPTPLDDGKEEEENR